MLCKADWPLMYVDVAVDIQTLYRVWRQEGQKILDAAASQARAAGVAVETTLLETAGQRVESVIVAEARR